jgi:hypothetical protein
MLLAYAGPIVGALLLNSLSAIFTALCVYIYLNRSRLSNSKVIFILSRPFHGIVKRVARSAINKKKN